MDFSNPITGMQKAIHLQNSSAEAISQSSSTPNPKLEEHMVDQITAKGSFSLNVRVAKVQNEMLGEIIDLIG